MAAEGGDQSRGGTGHVNGVFFRTLGYHRRHTCLILLLLHFLVLTHLKVDVDEHHQNDEHQGHLEEIADLVQESIGEPAVDALDAEWVDQQPESSAEADEQQHDVDSAFESHQQGQNQPVVTIHLGILLLVLLA